MEQHKFDEKDTYFSFISLTHLSEHYMILFALKKGMSIGFASSHLHIYNDIRILRPTLLVGTSKMFETLYTRFLRIRSTWNFIYRYLFDYAYKHQKVIAQFGRFPHRNSILNRESTPEETEFLNKPGSSF